MTCLTHCAARRCCGGRTSTRLCLAVLDEAVAVARADGARLAPAGRPDHGEAHRRLGPELGTSMYFDRLAGRARWSVEALSRRLSSLAAERLGIPTPLNARLLLTLLRAVCDAAGV